MPTEKQHLQQAAHNEKFFYDYDLVNSPYIDWSVVVLFYAALHYVEAFFAKQSPAIHCTRHPERDREVNRLLSPLYADYRDLKNDSVEARYKMKKFSADDVIRHVVPSFDSIKNHLAPN